MQAMPKKLTEFWNEDDMMGLTSICISDKDLTICPLTHSNLARYINSPGPKEKNNVNIVLF
jgi:hypothetical protein